MKTPAPADLQRWSEELARNPSSLAFLPLARAYRKLGRRDLALRLTLRGLEAHPANVEAHALLALLHLEEGNRARAADEWSIVLRLKPGNFEALRGMGFRYLEQNDIANARQHLERAALIRPDDTAVQEAIRLLRHREAVRAGSDAPPTAGPERRPGAPQPAPADATAVRLPPPVREAPPRVEPWLPAEQEDAGEVTLSLSEEDVVAASEEAAPIRTPQPRAEQPHISPAPAPAEDPGRAFDDVLRTGPVLGALLLDSRGLVLAGSIHGATAADDVGAILGAAVAEAVRTTAYLELDAWKGMLMECGSAVVHVRPVADQGVVVLAVAPSAPTGWVLRTAAMLAERAARFLEVPA